MNIRPEEIEAMVRRIVTQTLGATTAVPHPSQSAPNPKRPIIDADVLRQHPRQTSFALPPHALVTPLARQVALERRIQLEPSSTQEEIVQTTAVSNQANTQTIAIGADHGGYDLKETIKTMLETADFGYTVLDCGTHSRDSVDYPDFAYAVAQLVASGRAWRGIIIDGAGIGSCMAANKVPGVRAAMCYDQATAVNSREHNNANVLTLGAGLIGANLARQIVTTWLQTEFGGGRHARRVNKIDAIGKRFSK